MESLIALDYGEVHPNLKCVFAGLTQATRETFQNYPKASTRQMDFRLSGFTKVFISIVQKFFQNINALYERLDRQHHFGPVQ
jgi:hypothetical protein